MTAPERTPVSAVDAGRLARAIWLDCQRVALDRYFVSGGADDHVVVIQDGRVLCDCADAILRGDNCKHSLLTRSACGDPDVVLALRQLVPEPAQRKVHAA